MDIRPNVRALAAPTEEGFRRNRRGRSGTGWDGSRFVIHGSTTATAVGWEMAAAVTVVVGDFFLFLTFFKTIFKSNTVFFFKTNTFGRTYCHGAPKSLCRTMHGGAAGG